MEPGISIYNRPRKCGPRKVLVAKYVCVATEEGKLEARRAKFETRLMEHGVTPTAAHQLAKSNVTTLKRAPPLNNFVDKLPLSAFSQRRAIPEREPFKRLRRGPPPSPPEDMEIEEEAPFIPPPPPYLKLKKKKKKHNLKLPKKDLFGVPKDRMGISARAYRMVEQARRGYPR